MAATFTVASVDKSSYVREAEGESAINAVGTARVVFSDPAGSYVPSIHQTLAIAEGATTVFSGTITRVRVLRFDPTYGVVTEVDAANHNYLPLRVLCNGVYTSNELGDVLRTGTLFDALTGVSVTVLEPVSDTGPALGAQTFPWWSAFDVLNHLSTLTGYTWSINSTKGLSMVEIGSVSTGLTYSTGSSTRIKDVTWEQDVNTYRNDQYVVYGPNGGLETSDDFTGDSTTKSWELTYVIRSHQGYVNVNSSANTLLSSADVTYWSVTTCDNHLNSPTSAAPVLGTAIGLNYTADFPQAVNVQDSTGITDNGLYTAMNEAPDIITAAAATEYATALLRQFKVTNKRVTLVTWDTPTTPGKTAAITFAPMGLSGNHLCTSTRFRYFAGTVDTDGYPITEYLMEFISGADERQESWSEWWRRVQYGGGGGAAGGGGGAIVGGGTTTGALFAYLGGNVGRPTGGAGWIEVPGALYLLGAPMAGRTVTPYIYVRVVRGAGTITPRIVDGAGVAVSTSGSASSSTVGEYLTLETFTPAAGKTYRLQISMSVATDLGATEGYLYAA